MSRCFQYGHLKNERTPAFFRLLFKQFFRFAAHPRGDDGDRCLVQGNITNRATTQAVLAFVEEGANPIRKIAILLRERCRVLRTRIFL